MTQLMKLADDYLSGVAALRSAVDGMSRDEFLARPIPGKWSTLEVLAHLADMEAVFAERIKRVLAEDEPTFFDADADIWAEKLSYISRDPEVELALIEATRRQLAGILKSQSDQVLERAGTHSTAGRLTLEQLLKKVTGHLRHHVKFIDDKHAALRSR
jgi:hypothetical protein